MKRLLCLLLCACLTYGLVPAPAAAQTEQLPVTREDIMNMLGRIFDDDSARTELQRLGFRGQNLELASRQMNRVLSDRVVGGFIADELIAAATTGRRAEALTNGLLDGVITLGVPHLPARDLIFFSRVEQAVINGLSTRDCGLVARDRMPPAQYGEATGRVLARLETAALRDYYRIQLRAAQLGATRAPLTFSLPESRRIEAQILNALIARAGDDAQAQRVFGVLARPDRANNQQSCEATRFFMATVLEMNGREQYDALRYLNVP